MAGSGTGYPNSFVCYVARRSQTFDPVLGKTSSRLGYRYPPGHDRIVRTGRERPLASGQRGRGNPRALQYQVEYRCVCGYVGWTRLRDVLQKPVAGRENL